jgi:hypothetical protein
MTSGTSLPNLRLRDADNEGADGKEVASIVLALETDAVGVRRTWASHLARAQRAGGPFLRGFCLSSAPLLSLSVDLFDGPLNPGVANGNAEVAGDRDLHYILVKPQ